MKDRGQDEESFGALLGRAVADGRAYASAELTYWRAVMADRIGDVRSVAILAIAGLMVLNAAAIALIVGLILTLTPLVGPGFATLIVVLVALVVAGLLAMAALRQLKRVTRPIGEP